MQSFALVGVCTGAILLACSTTPDEAPPTGAPGGAATSGSTSSASGSSSAGAAQGGAAGSAPSGGGATAVAGNATAGSAGAVATGGAAGTSNAGGAAGAVSCGGASGTSALSEPIQPTQCAAPPGDAPAQAAAALTAVNALRSAMGIPCMALVPEINVSAQKHCDYYQQNLADKPCIANAHAEVATCAGFVAASFSQRMTAAGYTGSPRSEVMAFSGDAPRAIAQWINSVYHRTPLISPWIREMGYGGTMDCDTIDLGQGPQTPNDVTAVYPYPGQIDVPLDFDGSHEGPTPPEPPSGWPSASPVHLYAKNLTVTSHEIFAGSSCSGLAHQWLPENDHYILYPDQPFAKQTQYRVRIAGTRSAAPLYFEWTFTTETDGPSLLGCSAMSDSARLLTLEEKVAYQDKSIAELNDVVVDLNRQVSDLKARLEQMERLVGSELSRREMPNEKPPHY